MTDRSYCANFPSRRFLHGSGFRKNRCDSAELQTVCMATFPGLCCQDIVERRTVELERGEEGLGIAIQVGNIHSSSYMQRENQIRKFMW